MKVLERNALKNLMGGFQDAGGAGGGCCSYLITACPETGGYHRQCGMSMAAAKDRATELAIVETTNLQTVIESNGGTVSANNIIRAGWCCASCLN